MINALNLIWIVPLSAAMGALGLAIYAYTRTIVDVERMDRAKHR